MVADAGAPATADNPVWLYGLFAVIVLGLAALLLWLQRREGTT
jgi:hypothetical protein